MDKSIQTTLLSPTSLNLFIFSNPNNPRITHAQEIEKIYSPEEILTK